MNKIPDSYHIRDGCYNCQHSYRDNQLFCVKVDATPHPPWCYTDECFERILAWRESRQVRALGICDAWTEQVEDDGDDRNTRTQLKILQNDKY